MSGRGIPAQEGQGVLSGPPQHPEPKTSAAQFFPHAALPFSKGPRRPAPSFLPSASPETRTSILIFTHPAPQASRPPCAETVSLFPDTLAAPRYLILGCPRCSGSPRSPRGSSGPPFSQAGAGGAAPPRGAVGFSNTNTAPPPPSPQPRPFSWSRPFSRRESLSRAPPRFLPAPLASAQVPKMMPSAGCRVQGARYGVQHGSLPDKPLFHLDHAPFQSKPRPTCSSTAQRFSHTFFRPHCPAHSPKPRLLSLSRPPTSLAAFPIRQQPTGALILRKAWASSRLPPCPSNPNHPIERFGACGRGCFTELSSDTILLTRLGITRASSHDKFNRGKGLSEAWSLSKVHYQPWLLKSSTLTPPKRKEEEALSVIQAHE